MLAAYRFSSIVSFFRFCASHLKIPFWAKATHSPVTGCSFYKICPFIVSLKNIGYGVGRRKIDMLRLCLFYSFAVLGCAAKINMLAASCSSTIILFAFFLFVLVDAAKIDMLAALFVVVVFFCR